MQWLSISNRKRFMEMIGDRSRWWWCTIVYHVNDYNGNFFIGWCCYLLRSSKQYRFCCSWYSKWCANSCPKWHFNLPVIWSCPISCHQEQMRTGVTGDTFILDGDVGNSVQVTCDIMFNGAEMTMMIMKGWCKLCLHVTDDIVICHRF